MHQPTAKTSAAQRFLTFLTKMVIKVSKTITIVTVLGKRPQYPVLMNEKYKSGFGEAVRMQRAVCNLTKERLSLMVGINRLTLRRIESGDANPTLDVMYRISEGLGVPLSELIAQAEEAEKRDGASSKTD
ncbi:helix-turn-helix domain-containing protein [Eggerthella lenta]|uniref:helix-turn-helix domain-containing protein n=1 Tax=Eggerthella lenta TaxID=84112 RepID=UPI001E335548|nr:helix-turn-helix transcriptional regulator [Eggerthella lenta]MCQ4798143.1 helix-turn-helix domain-containing protein [Eggerthella lenta]MDU1906903.1 helix-turn-helix transcriptional regulator [Eggerthella sp.]